MSKETLCIFGSESFIAKNLIADIKINHSACDLMDINAIYNVIEKHKPTGIINCAARHGSATIMAKNHTEYFEENILMNINLLKAAHTLNIENVLLLGSISGFPYSKFEIFDEMNLYDGEVNSKNYGYNSSKRILNDLVKVYRLDFNRNYKVAHLGNIYGPKGLFDGNANLVGNLIYKIYNAKIRKSSVKFYGDGSDLRSLTYVGDLANILPMYTFLRQEFESMIISSNETISIKKLAELISLNMGYQGQIEFDSSINVTNRKIAKSIYFERLFPDFSFTSIEHGISRTIDWWLENQ